MNQKRAYLYAMILSTSCVAQAQSPVGGSVSNYSLDPGSCFTWGSSNNSGVAWSRCNQAVVVLPPPPAPPAPPPPPPEIIYVPSTPASAPPPVQIVKPKPKPKKRVVVIPKQGCGPEDIKAAEEAAKKAKK